MYSMYKLYYASKIVKCVLIKMCFVLPSVHVYLIIV